MGSISATPLAKQIAKQKGISLGKVSPGNGRTYISPGMCVLSAQCALHRQQDVLRNSLEYRFQIFHMTAQEYIVKKQCGSR